MPTLQQYQKNLATKNSIPITKEQIAHAYAIAVLLGYKKTLDEFKIEYSSALKAL